MRTKKSIIKKELKNYGVILKDIRFLLEKAKLRAYKAVDNIRVQTYWQVGERISRVEFEHKGRADYGRKLISQLSKDLEFDERLIYRMLQFYKLYPILSQVATELSWSHYVELMAVNDKKERRMYELLAIKNSWGRNALREQINKQTVKSYKKDQLIKLSPKATQLLPQDVFKDSYDFDFLELKQDFKEKDLKDALLSKFEAFIKELGLDFFIGRREVSVLIGGNYDKVDLELFHAGLMCYILVEIKIEEFKHAHVSQMYSYLNWYKENRWKKGQRLPIGLIICKSKDEETVHYALGDLRKEIFVSEYKIKLPSEKDIINRLKNEQGSAFFTKTRSCT